MRTVVILSVGLALISCTSPSTQPAKDDVFQPTASALTVEAAESYASNRVGVAGSVPVFAVKASNGRSICGIVRLQTGENVAYQYSVGNGRETALMAIHLDEARNRREMIPSMNAVVKKSCGEAGIDMPIGPYVE